MSPLQVAGSILALVALLAAARLLVYPVVPVLYERYLAWLKAKAAGK